MTEIPESAVSEPWPKHIQIAATDACREYIDGGDDGCPLAHIMAREILAAEKRGEERERERAALIALNYTFTEEGVRHSNMAVAIYASLAIAAAIRKGSD